MGTRALRAVIATALVLTSAAIATPTADAAPSASVVPSPNQLDYSMHRGVDCVTQNYCWAVGSWTHTDGRTLVEHWDGTAWKIVPSPNADWATDSHLTAVSCVSSTDCMAVGDASTLSSYDLDAPIDPLFLHWDGSTWTVAPGSRNGPKSFISPRGAARTPLLRGVSCTKNMCFAVGDRDGKTLVVRYR